MSTIPELDVWIFAGSKQDGVRVAHALQVAANMLDAVDQDNTGVQETLDAVLESLKQ